MGHNSKNITLVVYQIQSSVNILHPKDLTLQQNCDPVIVLLLEVSLECPRIVLKCSDTSKKNPIKFDVPGNTTFNTTRLEVKYFGNFTHSLPTE